MNWEAIGAIAELLGAVGVIATLAYLARQIRQNTSTVRTAAAAAQRQQSTTFNTFVAQDADVNRIWWAGLANPGALPEAERLRFESIASIITANQQEAHSMLLEGAISAKSWAGHNELIVWLASQPGFRAYWQNWSSMLDQEFVEHVSAVIEQSPLAAQQSAAADSAQA